MHRIIDGLEAAFHRPRTTAFRVVQSYVWLLIALSIVLFAVELVYPTDSPVLMRSKA